MQAFMVNPPFGPRICDGDEEQSCALCCTHLRFAAAKGAAKERGSIRALEQPCGAETSPPLVSLPFPQPPAPHESRKSKRGKVSPSALKSNLDDAPSWPCVPQVSSGEGSFQNPENLCCSAGEPSDCLLGRALFLRESKMQMYMQTHSRSVRQHLKSDPIPGYDVAIAVTLSTALRFLHSRQSCSPRFRGMGRFKAGLPVPCH